MAPLPRQMIYPQGMPQPRAVPMHPARNYYMLCVRFCLRKPARRLPTPNASSPWLEWQKQPPGSFFRRTAAQRRSKICTTNICKLPARRRTRRLLRHRRVRRPSSRNPAVFFLSGKSVWQRGRSESFVRAGHPSRFAYFIFSSQGRGRHRSRLAAARRHFPAHRPIKSEAFSMHELIQQRIDNRRRNIAATLSSARDDMRRGRLKN